MNLGLKTFTFFFTPQSSFQEGKSERHINLLVLVNLYFLILNHPHILSA